MNRWSVDTPTLRAHSLCMYYVYYVHAYCVLSVGTDAANLSATQTSIFCLVFSVYLGSLVHALSQTGAYTNCAKGFALLCFHQSIVALIQRTQHIHVHIQHTCTYVTWLKNDVKSHSAQKILLQSNVSTSVISANHTAIHRVNVLYIFEGLDTQWDQTKAWQTKWSWERMKEHYYISCELLLYPHICYWYYQTIAMVVYIFCTYTNEIGFQALFSWYTSHRWYIDKWERSRWCIL